MPSAKDVIRSTIGTGDYMINTFISDLTDDDLLVAAVEGMNPIAWQLGHLLVSERDWVEKIAPGSCPPLPEGFEAAHSKETAAPAPFRPVAGKAEYLAAWSAQRAATLAVLDGLTDPQLAAATGIDYAPSVADMLNLIGVHAVEHAGQFVAVRRKLAKPVLM